MTLPDALSIFQAALDAADPKAAVRRAWRERGWQLEGYRRVFVVGAGKAAAAMAQAVEEIVGERITAGLINVKYGHSGALKRIEQKECGHPVPDAAGVAGARRIAELCGQAEAEDLVICLISGGASALLPLPVAGVTLEQKQSLTRALLASGADIHEINTVRKHLSGVKGGQLALRAAPAHVIALLLSDVIGDDPDVIGSGPTVADRSTVEDARAVLRKYGLTAPELRETPKSIENAENVMVASNRQSVAAAAKRAGELGYEARILTSSLEGEAREAARVLAAILQDAPPRSCLIAGGETTVTLGAQPGKGGRNQEFALAAALALRNRPAQFVLAAGTDGSDGPTDAAGAWGDSGTCARAAARGLDAAAFLAGHDAYPFFEAMRQLVVTGPTGTNVMDLYLLAKG